MPKRSLMARFVWSAGMGRARVLRARRPPSNARPLGPVSVLLVEPDESAFLATLDALSHSTEAAYTLDRASSVDAAVERAGGSTHDIVLASVSLGPAAIADLVDRLPRATRRAPLVLVGHRAGVDLARLTRTLGATAYLRRENAEPAVLERAISQLVERSRRRGRQERADAVEALPAGDGSEPRPGDTL